MQSRREFIGISALGLAGWAVPGVAGAQGWGGARLEPAVTALGPDAVMISGTGANVVAAADAEGVVMVDGGLAEGSDALLDAVAAAFDSRPVRTLFNTHWHPQQTGANLALAQSGAEVISQVNTRLWLGTDIHRPWEDRVHQPLPEAARPVRTFYEEGREVELGGEPLRYGHLLQAHTDGDCYVYFPRSNVLACGGLVAGDRWPEIDWWTGGWLGGLVEGIGTLLQVADEETRIVPSHGPVLNYADLAAQRDMYAELFVRFRDQLLFKGLSPAEAVAARPTAGLHGDWPGRDEFVTLAFQSLWGFYAPDV